MNCIKWFIGKKVRKKYPRKTTVFRFLLFFCRSFFFQLSSGKPKKTPGTGVLHLLTFHFRRHHHDHHSKSVFFPSSNETSTLFSKKSYKCRHFKKYSNTLTFSCDSLFLFSTISRSQQGFFKYFLPWTYMAKNIMPFRCNKSEKKCMHALRHFYVHPFPSLGKWKGRWDTPRVIQSNNQKSLHLFFPMCVLGTG